jgi:hypothetical protein
MYGSSFWKPRALCRNKNPTPISLLMVSWDGTDAQDRRAQSQPGLSPKTTNSVRTTGYDHVNTDCSLCTWEVAPLISFCTERQGKQGSLERSNCVHWTISTLDCWSRKQDGGNFAFSQDSQQEMKFLTCKKPLPLWPAFCPPSKRPEPPDSTQFPLQCLL